MASFEILRQNVITATRNYKERFQAFLKEFILNPNSELSVKYYSTKLEFQGRGAAHNHGVLWVDLKKMEMKMTDVQGRLTYVGDILPKKDLKKVKFLLRKALYTVNVKKENLMDMYGVLYNIGSIFSSKKKIDFIPNKFN